ncbi:hypothetical protein Hypma_007810 [Hypsizygus marmoreus]|uniref:Uncharacterized protein n=1 Tax=Hypsizygus marmoreus TaxID=39966 RepID=A0A369JWY8_HYPMA|nr:hypothetical protein Hypma_007810 [Hypsizygus marmoreus]
MPDAMPENLFFKNDRIYRHRIFRINYTTYDVRRAQDVINPNTPHRDVMVLAPSQIETEIDDAGMNHKFLYGRILGIYHANIVYSGPTGIIDYRPRRMDFLWVRWFQLVDRTSSTGPGDWDSRQLDCIKFPSVNSPDAFGFLDPAEVLRGCHILPRTALGRVHADNVGISQCAKDSGDWKMYFVNRFVDRDMVMRYYWGLGVGHVYSHGSQTHPIMGDTTNDITMTGVPNDGTLEVDNNDINMGEEINLELGMDDIEEEDAWVDHADEMLSASGSDGQGSEGDYESDDSLFHEYQNMYNP